MKKADGNRKMWLLKSTSGHHRPECLAAALALGILAGLVPKLNLLALILYGLILVLPVHTILAVTVSICVALLSFQLDATAHRLGESLLRQDTLRPLWISLERAPLVPWMSLHNTIVLGHLVIGTILLAPIYMISLRIFEHVEYGGRSRRSSQPASIQSYAPVTTEEPEPLTTKKEPYRQRDGSPDHRRSELPKPQESTVDRSPQDRSPQDRSPQDRSPLIVPPPKFLRVATESESRLRLNAPDEPILFEPIDEVQQRMNEWHMNRGSGEAQYATAGPSRNLNTESAALNAPNVSPTTSSIPQIDDFYPQMSGPGATDRISELSFSNLPTAPTRPEGVLDSLQLAQNTSEVLAWVDDLLDECMAAEGMMTLAHDYNQTANIGDHCQASTDADASTSDQGVQGRWLLETTTEIVRLTEETISDELLQAEQSIDCQAQSELSELRSKEILRDMPADSMTRAWPGTSGVVAASGTINTALPAQAPGEPTILNLNQVTGRGRDDDRGSFQQLVMANGLNDSLVKNAEQRPNLPIEPVKGECLAYLLGHLRQSREGKSS